MANHYSIVYFGGEFQIVSASAQRPSGWLIATQGNSIYPVASVTIVIKQYRTFGSRGRCGVAKKLWGTGGEPRPAGSAEGTPAEQTREEMLAIKVEKEPIA